MMIRAIFGSLVLFSLGLLAGCGGGSSGGGGTPPQPNALNGQYAFLLAGFDANGFPVGISGSMKADGLGHISAGEVDVNDNGTESTSSSVAGTYAFDAGGEGSTGTIQLTNTVGSLQALAFAFSLQTSGDFGSIMSLDSNNFNAGGTMQQQTSAVFNFAGLAGNFVVTINGRNQSNPTSALGSFALDSSGLVSNVSFDRSVAGVSTAGPTTNATLTFGASGPDSNGRGTFTLTLNDALASSNQTFAYYAITAKRIVAVETDASGTMTADFASQTIPATPTITGSVFGMSGIDASVNETSAVGQLVMTGVGATNATFNWDSNDNGSIHSGISLPSQAVTSYSPTTGRGTATVTGGTGNGLADTLVFYLNAPGAGFIMDGTTGTTNTAMAGPLMAQAAAPFSAATDLAGVGIVRSRGNSASDALSLVGLFGPSSALYELLFDDREGFGANLLTQGPDIAIPGIAVGAVATGSGRGTLSGLNGNSNSTFAFYIIGPNQFYMVDITSGDASTIFFVSPQ
jgi:hypothetical protein